MQLLASKVQIARYLFQFEQAAQSLSTTLFYLLNFLLQNNGTVGCAAQADSRIQQSRAACYQWRS